MRVIHNNDFSRLITQVAFIREPSRQVYDFKKKEMVPFPADGLLGTDCLLELPTNLFDEALKQFAEIAAEKGMKLDSDMKREGQLEATKYHLEDLRKMLKLTG